MSIAKNNTDSQTTNHQNNAQNIESQNNENQNIQENNDNAIDEQTSQQQTSTPTQNHDTTDSSNQNPDLNENETLAPDEAIAVVTSDEPEKLLASQATNENTTAEDPVENKHNIAPNPDDADTLDKQNSNTNTDNQKNTPSNEISEQASSQLASILPLTIDSTSTLSNPTNHQKEPTPNNKPINNKQTNTTKTLGIETTETENKKTNNIKSDELKTDDKTPETNNQKEKNKKKKKEDTELTPEEKAKKEKAAQLENYRKFIAEQENNRKIDHQQVRITIEAGALPSKMYFGMNALSAVIASYGLISNSPAVVIGAMLVAMMLGPITGVALAVIDYRFPFLRRSLLTVFLGGLIVIGIGFIVGLLHNGQPLTNEILSRTQPTSMDLMIALAGGTAGAYAMISPNLPVAVVGVAVATALVPPLAASGILFAHGETSLGFGALLLAFTNIIAIQFTNALVLWLAGFRHLVEDDYKSGTFLTFIRRNAISLLLLLVLGVYLTFNFNKIAKQQRFENYVQNTISDYFLDKGNVLTATQFVKRSNYQTIRAVVRGDARPTKKDVRILQQKISQTMSEKYPNSLPIHLQLRYVPIEVIELGATGQETDSSSEQLNQTDAAILASP